MLPQMMPMSWYLVMMLLFIVFFSFLNYFSYAVLNFQPFSKLFLHFKLLNISF